METLIIILAGALVTVATYLLLSKNIIRVILGTAILTHAGHLLLMSMGGFEGDRVRILGGSTTEFVDALLQGLVLTSILFSLRDSANFLVLAYVSLAGRRTDDVLRL